MIDKLLTDLNYVQALDDLPNDVTGITSAQLKAVFDKAGNTIKDYLNGLEIYSKAEVDQIAANFILGQLGNGSVTDVMLSNDSGQIKDRFTSHLADYVRQPGYGVDSGAANAYIIALDPAPTAYTDGMGVIVKIANANTGASTINVNSLGAKTIVNPDGTALSSGDLTVGGIYSFKYNSTTSNFILVGKGGVKLTGTAVPGDVASGETFYNTDGKTKLTGTGANVKRWATGAVTNALIINPTELAFTPTIVIIFATSLASSERIDFAILDKTHRIYNNGSTIQVVEAGINSASAQWIIPNGTITWDSNGFNYTMNYQGNYIWYAFE